MKINPDRTVNLKKGEYIPFNCPKCFWSVPYDEKLLVVRCPHCRHIGTIDEFSREYSLKKIA